VVTEVSRAHVASIFKVKCLKIEVTCSFETLAIICKTTWRHNPQQQEHLRENFIPQAGGEGM
jgi:hypothetical protein